MEDSLYEIIEVTGNSSHSLGGALDDAVSNAANESRNLRSFTVVDTRGTISGGKVESWQVTLKIGFTTTTKSPDTNAPEREER